MNLYSRREDLKFNSFLKSFFFKTIDFLPIREIKGIDAKNALPLFFVKN
jgi:hypothetical protein